MTVLQANIVVIGAGISGVCAALAAARHDVSVILAGDRPVVGGNSSSEIRMWTRGATGAGNLYSEEMGILGELKLRNLQTNPDGNVYFWDEVLLDALYSEKKITLLLNTYITDVKMQDSKIISVHGYQQGSEREYDLLGDMFIDCTGDGTIAYKAGVPFRMGQEAASEYDEETAPATASSTTMGNSIYYAIKSMDHDVPYVAPAYVYSIEEIQGIIDRGGRIVDEKQSLSDYWWFEYGGLLHTIDNAQEINFELKRLALGVWNYIKNSGKFDASRLTLEWIGSFAGKRESRRMTADYILTQNDIQNTRSFFDNGFYGGWYLDFHPSAGIYSDENSCVQYPVRTYPIPLRTLFNRNWPNLLFAGRIIGVTHAAFASTRIMDTCALSGQAAGTLGAISINKNLSPAETVGTHIQELQQILLYDDMLVIDTHNADPNDFARQAQVSASGYLQTLPNKRCGSFSLERGGFVQLAVPANVNHCTLGISGEKQFSVDCGVYYAPLPSRLSMGEWLGNTTINYTPGGQTEIALPVSDINRFLTIVIPPLPDVSINTVEKAPLGFKVGAQWSMDHAYPEIYMPLKELYYPGQVINGLNRAYVEPGLWISDSDGPKWIQLQWSKKINVSKVVLYLNPDLSQELPSSFAQRWNASHMIVRPKSERPWELVASMDIQIPNGENWHTVASIHDNWQRRVVINLPQMCSTDVLRINFENANRTVEQYAQLFELRVY